MYIVSIMGKIAIVLIYFFCVFAQSYPCCPRTFGTALVYVNGSGSITSVGEERANLSVVVYL